MRLALHWEAGQRLARPAPRRCRSPSTSARGAAAGDTEAIGWLTRAAREAAPSSPETAADLLGRAIGLMSPRTRAGTRRSPSGPAA